MAETINPINPGSNVPEYTVSEISGGVKRMLEDRFGRVRVRGEISGWKGPHSSGHAYFRLKDEGAVLDAVCWKGTLGRVGCKPEEGLEVIATGRITSYPGKSSYQIVVERMEPAGQGALMLLLEKRRAALAAEGLFDTARKKPLPYLPSVIGVVTSPTGAVIRDILHRLEDRFPCRVIVWPVAVQGEGAAAQVAEAIRGFQNFTPKPDVLIVARGGGSLEDLWAFNEEVVVRAAAASAIPLISAVGHETDTTLIDFASDRRAPTPTAAAEMAVPVRAELMLGLGEIMQRLQASIFRGWQQRKERLEGLSRGLPRPVTLLEHATQRLDDWSERLTAAVRNGIQRREDRLTTLSRTLPDPRTLLARSEERLQGLTERLQLAATRKLSADAEKLSSLTRLLEALNYKSVLKRGYALVSSEKGQVITSAEAAAKEPSLRITFHDGELGVIRKSP